MFYVYAIQSRANERIYVGFTENIERRLREHNSGYTTSTKGYRPWKLIYQESCETRTQARKREKQLKSGYGKEFLKSLHIPA